MLVKGGPGQIYLYDASLYLWMLIICMIKQYVSLRSSIWKKNRHTQKKTHENEVHMLLYMCSYARYWKIKLIKDTKDWLGIDGESLFTYYISYVFLFKNVFSVDSRLAPSQWETSLQSNAVSHWVGANLESVLHGNGSYSASLTGSDTPEGVAD